MEDLQLVDYYRVTHPEMRVYTWRENDPLKQDRLDYILISESLSNIVEKFSIKPNIDQIILLLSLSLNLVLSLEVTVSGSSTIYMYDEVYVPKVT